MSDDVAIRVEGLGKKYMLQHQRAGGRSKYTALRDVLAEKFLAPFKFLKSGMHSAHSSHSPTREEFWALKDLSFEIKRGEAVGIIGRNGAGKSTLLKLLSRITHPTTGRIELNGRIASLLEVGTGFHPELTGRENIYLNGAILGMRRVEIKRKFDEIVAFAEVDRFLDTPVKRYSSGMYVRLAFAVAAHLEPEILVVDEVLAVGDAQFQKKCLGKMGDVSNDGRTVLFVSHHMPSIQRLCDSVILLQNGSISKLGKADQIIPEYLSNSTPSKECSDLTLLPKSRRHGNGRALFTKIELLTDDGRQVQEIRQGEPLTIRLHITAQAALEQVAFGFSFVASDGTEILGTTAQDCGISGNLAKGTQVFVCRIAPMILRPGQYSIRGAVFRHGEVFDHIDEMFAFDVLNVAYDICSAPGMHVVGHVYLPFKWHYHYDQQSAP